MGRAERFGMMNTLTQAECRYHPERPGVGVCVKCRTVICAECSTRLDGINHCAVCVAKLRDAAPLEDGAQRRGLRVLALAGLSASLALGGYAALHMALLW